MNVGLILTNAVNAAKKAAGPIIFAGKKHAPELMIGGGLFGFVVTIVETVKATNKTNEIIENKESRIERCKAIFEEKSDDENLPRYSEVDYSKDIRVISSKAKWDIVKAWIPVGTAGVASVILVLGGYKILNGRYVATAAAYKAIEASFDRYRDNVINEFGEDTDWRMRNSIKAEEVEAEREQHYQAKTKSLTSSKKPTTTYQREAASLIFDQYSDYWRKNWSPDQVWNYLIRIENEMTDQLNIRGHVFLNEVYDRLGYSYMRTKEGQVLGWVRDRRNPNKRISFGLDKMPEEARREFLSHTYNDDIWLRLYFNVDGVILNFIDRTPDI